MLCQGGPQKRDTPFAKTAKHARHEAIELVGGSISQLFQLEQESSIRGERAQTTFEKPSGETLREDLDYRYAYLVDIESSTQPNGGARRANWLSLNCNKCH